MSEPHDHVYSRAAEVGGLPCRTCGEWLSDGYAWACCKAMCGAVQCWTCARREGLPATF